MKIHKLIFTICAFMYFYTNTLVANAEGFAIANSDTFFHLKSEEANKIVLIHEGDTILVTDIQNNNIITKIDNENGTIKTEDVLLGDEINIPSNSGFKSWMPYNIFNSKTQQGKLQEIAITDENGFRLVNNRYCVAVGSGVSNNIGQYFDVLLENGEIIPCIMGDQKADCHTQSNNIITAHNGCCTEFLIDKKTLNSDVKKLGDVSALKEEWDSPIETIIVYDKNYFE